MIDNNDVNIVLIVLKKGLGYQLRQRRILSNASAGGVECPALSQMRRCRADPLSECAAWRVDALDACQLPENFTCGLGYRQLVLHCRRNFDQVSTPHQTQVELTIF